ncbi:GAF domain-containing protein [Aquibacillus koreensis]|uniref:GAF domain-containing protein n=1 Tax=Aquibacillus koreensis TaxID=279446 RepID=A0A9X4AHQ4_9BACI|nr:GAF domain-containing protein [Aquibacillus koreensis]MCT2535896.1 GAF domain-containing protein [Aquibacillus koreensis]MDC3420352.1 GAF domain-containing protein [Aquibacillus koreensis]
MEYKEEQVQELEQQFLLVCDQLRQQLSCDFTGVALQKIQGVDITWPFVSGNRNQKYKYITVRYGKGIAGRVIASGSPMEIVQFPDNIIGKSTEYPIMLAEKMITAYAMPLLWQGSPKGALLIGYRSKHRLEENDYVNLKELGKKVEKLLPLYFAEN